MKPYKDVIKERYDGSEKDVHAYKNIYSLINPIGFNGDKQLRCAFYNVFNLIKNTGVDITKSSILDIGCGKGATTRFFSELTGNTNNIYGFDLSEHRIECAKKMNSNINYTVGDILHSSPFSAKFDIVTVLDVFMHLNDKKDIMLALQNIKEQMNDSGYFIWYDTYSKDHFKTNPNDDHSGFYPGQMIQLAEEAGFKKVKQINIFKKLFWKYHSLYLVNKFPASFVKFFEYIIPGSPGNVLIVFKNSL